MSLCRTLFIILGLFSVAPPLPAQGTPAAADTLPTVKLPADLDRVLRDYERAWRANDIPALVALFTDDGFVLQPGRPPARGKVALERVYRGQAGGPLRLRALSYAEANTVAYIIGAYAYGDAPGDQGKFTLALRRQRGGRWLIASDMDNGSQPQRRAPTQPSPTGNVDSKTSRVTVLVDAFGQRDDLRKDWGYAALIEYNGLRILFDTGNDSELFRHNVETLGIDLKRLDFVVISHRHGDHTDGLRYLLGLNPQVRIYASNDEYFGGPTPRVFFRDTVNSLPDHMRYFGGQVPASLPHGSPWKNAKVQRVDGAVEVAPGVMLVNNVSRSSVFSETPEVSLVLETPQGRVVVVGCSHPGIEQILESVEAAAKSVRLVIGGLHWVNLPDDKVESLANALHSRYKVAAIAPGHCTGEKGFAALSRIYGRRYVYAGLGTAINL